MRTNLSVVTTYGRNGGSARVRVFDWLCHLGLGARESTYLDTPRLGPRVVRSRPLATARAEFRVRHLSSELEKDTLLLSRRASPFSRGHLEQELLRRANRGVYDFDDSLLSDRRWPFGAHAVWRRAVESADMVIAGNEVLLAQARELTDKVVMIPSCVEPSQYQLAPHLGSVCPTAVWIGSPSTEKFLHHIEGSLLEAHDEVGLRLRVISSGAATLGNLDRMVDRVEWRASSFGLYLSTADFGIMPLSDDEWSRGKCAYKLLQYGASGLPMIGSPVGANERVLTLCNGWAATTPSEWARSLRDLLGTSPEERRTLGITGRAAIERHYSYQAWAPTFLEALRGRAS